MSTTEALRIQVDELRLRNQELEVQVRRLREERADEAALLDIEKERDACRRELESKNEENDRLKALYEQLLRDTQSSQEDRIREREEKEAVSRRLEQRCRDLEETLKQTEEKAELERYRAIEQEKAKWERREARLHQQLILLEEQRNPAGHQSRVDSTHAISVPSDEVQPSYQDHCHSQALAALLGER